MQKTCTKCYVEKPLEAFPRNAAGKFGRKSTCLACSRKYWVENKPRLSAESKTRRLNNLEERRAKDRAYYAANTELIRGRNKAQYEKHRDKRLAYEVKARIEKKAQRMAYHASDAAKTKHAAVESKRRALCATPAWANKEMIEIFYESARRVSQRLGTRYEVDHIVPIKGRTVCGLHVEHNLRVIPRTDNAKKLNRFDHQMFA